MADMILFLSQILILLFIANAQTTTNSNIIRPGSSLSPNTNNSYWLSESGEFAFGFYQYGNGFSLGIWFEKTREKTLVWTANRDDPPFPKDVTLLFTSQGRLVLQPKQGQEILIANTTSQSASMLDSGNFVLFNSSSDIIWQSFDFPTDTILSGQPLLSGHNLVSDVSATNHTSGKFELIMQSDGNLVQYPLQAITTETAYWRTGTSTAGNGVTLNLARNGRLYLVNANGSNIGNISREVQSVSGSPTYRATIDADGIFRVYSYVFNQSDIWSIIWESVTDKCDVIGLCGVNSYCTVIDAESSCQCLPGFDFIDQSHMDSGCYKNYSGDACRGKSEQTFEIDEVGNLSWELDDVYYIMPSISKDACKEECLRDCICEAALYQNEECKKLKLPLTYGRRETNQATTFVKIGAGAGTSGPVLGGEKVKQPQMGIFIVGISSLALGSILVLVSCGFFVFRHRVGVGLGEKKWILNLESSNGFAEDVALRSFTYEELKIASDGFTQEIGRGSCGTVFKGVIISINGSRNVAIKRLEKVVSTEGQREFKNEMRVIGKTHHKNLVQLLGYCHEGGNMLLIYEHMSNGSLADFFFKARSKTDWEGRIEIALDIARGILYLHQECETQIIHCDIKPENILIDDKGCAKIADFGLAKLLMSEQTKTYTGIRGTRGYVAPEWWHQNSLITAKVDVYSFGIMLLEIICCRRSIDMNAPESEVVLAYWVYDCFMAGELEELVKDEQVDVKMLERMVKVGLWCIQDDPTLRPSMKKVVQMLEGTIDIPLPPCRPTTSFTSFC